MPACVRIALVQRSPDRAIWWARSVARRLLRGVCRQALIVLALLYLIGLGGDHDSLAMAPSGDPATAPGAPSEAAPAADRSTSALAFSMQPRQVLEAINQHYAALFDVPRRVIFWQSTITRGLKREDVYMRVAGVFFQYRDQVRFESYPHTATLHPNPVGIGTGRPAGTLIWVHDGRYTKSIYRQPNDPNSDAADQLKAFLVDHWRMPKELGTRFTSPMLATELPDEFMAHAFVSRREVFRGRNVLTLRSTAAIALSPEHAMEVKLWVDPSRFLVERMDYQVSQTTPAGVPQANIEGTVELVYELHADIPEGTFQLDEDIAFQDITDEVIQKVEEKRRWRNGP